MRASRSPAEPAAYSRRGTDARRHDHRGSRLILCLDTSALIKLLASKAGTSEMQPLAAGAETLTASRIAYVECNAALARAESERRLARGEARRSRRLLEELWMEVAIVELDQLLAAAAAHLAGRHVLRGMGAIEAREAGHVPARA